MSTISKVGVLKGVLELAASAGVGVVVGNLVKATTPEDTSRLQKILASVGGYTISAVLSDLSAKHVAAQVDGYHEKYNAIFHPELVETPLDPEEVVEVVTKIAEVMQKNEKATAASTKKAIKDKFEPGSDGLSDVEKEILAAGDSDTTTDNH